MSRATTRTKQEVTETGAPFALRIPGDFDVKPDYEVALPRKHKALIFKTLIRKQRVIQTADARSAAVHEDVPGYRVWIVKGDGSAATDIHYGGNAYETDDPFDVQLTLRGYAAKLTPKKRVMRREEVEDYDD
jgi:hypothetical protein